MTIIELMVVTTILALMAALIFPSFRLMQQRDRENRLREILSELDAARDSYKSYVSRQMWDKIEAAHSDPNDREKAFKQALASATELGLLFPLSPASFIYPLHAPGASFTVATDPDDLSDDPAKGVSVSINRRFIRHIPPHPFSGWAPNARFEFGSAVDSAGPNKKYPETDWPTTATGVKNVWSVGAGLGIDGSSTDEW